MPNTNCSSRLKRYFVQQNNKMINTMKAAIQNRPIHDDDYPKVAIACEYGGHQAFGHSLKCHKSIKQNVNYVTPLRDALGVYGVPPEVKIISGKIIFVGTCAEDSAANQVMEACYSQHYSYPKLKNLIFTQPRRPRTYQRRKFCDVCKAIF